MVDFEEDFSNAIPPRDFPTAMPAKKSKFPSMFEQRLAILRKSIHEDELARIIGIFMKIRKVRKKGGIDRAEYVLKEYQSVLNDLIWLRRAVSFLENDLIKRRKENFPARKIGLDHHLFELESFSLEEVIKQYLGECEHPAEKWLVLFAALT